MMRHRRSSHRAAGALLLGVAAAAGIGSLVPARARAETWDVDTGFRAEQHGWAIPNFTRKVASVASVAAGASPTALFAYGGSCAGMAITAQLAFMEGRDDFRATTAALGEGGARLFAATAQADTTTERLLTVPIAAGLGALPRVILGAPDRTSESTPDPGAAARSVYAELGRTRMPQALALGGPSASHMVLVTAARQEGHDIVFQLYDPNQDTSPDADKRLDVYLRVEHGSRTFTISSRNRDTGEEREEYLEGGRAKYTGLRHDESHRIEGVRRVYRALYDDAADGSLDGRTGKADRLGGVLLGTRARFPEGLEPSGLALRGDRVVLVAADGELEVEGLTPGSLGVLLRSVVLAREPAGLSIGTEPSERPGYLKVTYLGRVRGSHVGRALLDADIRLKGIFINAGLGEGGRPTPTPDTHRLLTAFPGIPPQSFCRLWFVGTEVRLARRGDRLAATSSGLELRLALAYRGRRAIDPEAERFVRALNDRWPDIAADVPELRRLEELALAAALARWVAESDVAVDPDLWGHPYTPADCPDHVPGAVEVNGHGLVASEGGIGLSGDTVAMTLGMGLGLVASARLALYCQDASALALVLWGALLFGLVAAPIAVLARVVERGSAWRRAWRAAVAWGGLLLGLLGASIFVAEGLGRVLGPFDLELCCVAAGLLGPHLAVRQLCRRRGAPPLLGLGVLAVATLLALSVAASSGAARWSAARGWSPGLALACRVTSAPIDVAACPLVGQVAETSLVVTIPTSIARSTLWRLEIPGEDGRSSPRRGAVEHFSLYGTMGPVGSLVTLERVDPDEFESPRPLFTAEGVPLY